MPPTTSAPVSWQLEAMRRVALVVASASGPALLETLVAEVARALPAAAVLISVFTGDSRTTLRVLAMYENGQPQAGFDYPVAGSPCAKVVGREYRYLPSGVSRQVDPHSLFAAGGYDAYAAFPLNDSEGRPLGVFAALDRKPIAHGDAEHAEVVLKVVAGRLAAELERQRALESLRRSEASYRGIFEAAPDSILVHDWETFAIRDANRTAEQNLGYTREELLAIEPHALMSGEPPYDLEHAFAHLRQAKLGRCPPFEWRTRLKDGTLQWQEVHLKPVVIDGAPRILAFTRDITERKAAEERLRDSESQYRAIFDASADALMLWDSQLRRVDANPANERLFGFARDESIGGGLENLPYPEDYIRPRVEMLRRALAGEASRAELEAVRRDGSRILVEMRTIPFEHRGEPHALQIARDITERKRAEHQLRASEEQHRTIFNASVDGMLVKDAANLVVDVNDAYLHMHGFTRDELIGQCLLDYLPLDLRMQCRTLLPAVLEGTPCHFRAQTWRKDRSLLDVEIHGVPVVYGGQTRALVIMRDITAPKAAEERLRRSEEQYRAIFDASADALVLRDEAFRIVDVNATYERMSGWTRDEVLGLDRLVANPASVAPEIRALHEQALAGEPIALEVPLLRRDGARYELELRGVPIHHRGRPHVLYMGRDVTERKRAEATLQAQEERYRSVFDGSVDPIVLWDSQLKVVDVNVAFVRMYGYARERVVGRHWSQRDNASELVTKVPLLEAALAGQPSQVFDRVGRAGGGHMDMELRYLPMRVGSENFVLGIGRDVSERLQRERALAQSESRLRASEEQYRAIFNASVDALTLWDSRVRRVDINTAYERLYGWSREDVIGMGYEDLPFGEAYYAPRQNLVRRALAGEACRAELESIRKDGQVILTELHAVPFRHRGEPHVLVIGRDITARRAAESERARLEEQLRQSQKMEAIGQLTGGIAHDFNNILTSVLGNIVLAQERAQALAEPRLQRQLAQALQAGERARDLVAQMLSFARRKSGRRQLLSPQPLLQETVELLRPTLPSSVLLEVAAAAPAPPAVEADPVQIGQVLMNLLINARDAVAGAGRVELGLGARGGGWRCASCAATVAGGSWVEVRVTDNGCGIASEALHRVFDPFFTTKPAGQGTGMGLAMVHGIVHDHGGHIVVDTRVEEGSTFRVLLPAAAAAPSAVAETPAGAPAPALAGLTGRVLVVEDDAQVGNYLTEQLEAWGLEVVLQTDARAAMRWLGSDAGSAHAVITDLTMPHLSGLELARMATRLRPGLPVLLVSADLAAADAHSLAASGVRAALAKPIDAAALRRALADALADAH